MMKALRRIIAASAFTVASLALGHQTPAHAAFGPIRTATLAENCYNTTVQWQAGYPPVYSNTSQTSYNGTCTLGTPQCGHFYVNQDETDYYCNNPDGTYPRYAAFSSGYGYQYQH